MGDAVDVKTRLVTPAGLRKVSDGIYHPEGKEGKAVVFSSITTGNYHVLTASVHKEKNPFLVIGERAAVHSEKDLPHVDLQPGKRMFEVRTGPSASIREFYVFKELSESKKHELLMKLQSSA